MTVLLNKWDSQRFEQNDVRCDFCRRHGTVKEFTAGDCIVRICKICLLDMVTEIDRAILADKAGYTNPCRPEARREGN